MKPNILVTVIVVTYNSEDVISSCLEPLAHVPGIEIVVWDNASSDRSVEIARSVAPSANVIRSASNDGFARAVNAASKHARGEFLFLLNPDATILARDLLALCATLQAHPDIAIASPQVSEGEGTFVTVAAGYRPTIWRMFSHASGLARLAGRAAWLRGHYLLRTQILGEALVDVEWVSGGCLLVRSRDWVDHDGLTEKWFMYAEDVEFCLRVHSSGRRVVIDPQSRATHQVGGSSSDRSETISTMWIENLFDMYSSWPSTSRLHATAWKMVVAGGFVARASVLRAHFLLTRRESSRLEYARFEQYSRALIGSNPK